MNQVDVGPRQGLDAQDALLRKAFDVVHTGFEFKRMTLSSPCSSDHSTFTCCSPMLSTCFPM